MQPSSTQQGLRTSDVTARPRSQRQLHQVRGGLRYFGTSGEIEYMAKNYVSSISSDTFVHNLNLRVLNFSANGLSSLFDLSSNSNLEILDVSHNAIAQLTEVRALLPPSLASVNLRANRIRELIECTHLARLPRLTVLNISENAFASVAAASGCDYRIYLVHILPHLKSLNESEIGQTFWYAFDVSICEGSALSST